MGRRRHHGRDTAGLSGTRQGIAPGRGRHQRHVDRTGPDRIPEPGSGLRGADQTRAKWRRRRPRQRGGMEGRPVAAIGSDRPGSDRRGRCGTETTGETGANRAAKAVRTGTWTPQRKGRWVAGRVPGGGGDYERKRWYWQQQKKEAPEFQRGTRPEQMDQEKSLRAVATVELAWHGMVWHGMEQTKQSTSKSANCCFNSSAIEPSREERTI
mmetsp:Transcript_3531/g.9917  ORF Transcript_3531/g.9917 Transcript_3531/m.9917 type:complete len:211 (+) Transcript_3531:496-1128(+)